MAITAAEHPPVTSWRQILGIVGRAMLLIALILPVAIGVVAGCAVWFYRWLDAAVGEGYSLVIRQ